MTPRQLEGTLHRLAAAFPVVAIAGPRQSGKTTLARALFADRPYVSLEDPAERAFAPEDPTKTSPPSSASSASAPDAPANC